jgi:ferrochelatase
MKPDAVLLAGFGGPESPAEILPYLRRVTHGRGVPESRLAIVAAQYAAIGGASPYNGMVAAFARSLASALAQRGAAFPVQVGLRHCEPSIPEAVRALRAAGHRLAAGIMLAPHRSGASTGRYMEETAAALAAHGGAALAVEWVAPWFDEPGFLEACAQRIEQKSGHVRGAWPREIPILFTAHSIRRHIAESSPYVSDITRSCRGVASLLGAAEWELAWQSRSGSPAEPWLEPDINDVIARRAAGAREIVVQAIGFLFDHVEVLYDLDVRAAAAARAAGVRLLRAPCAHDHPAFIAMLADRILGPPPPES